jgi:hypothetical protein
MENENSVEGQAVREKRSYRKSVSGSLSRRVILLARAVQTGTWSTGSAISRDKVAGDLAVVLSQLSSDEFSALTKRCHDQLSKVKTLLENQSLSGPAYAPLFVALAGKATATA